MAFSRVALTLLAACCLLAGCGREKKVDPYARFELGQGRDVVAEAVKAMGGLERWEQVDNIKADAIVKIYDDDGTAFVTHQQQDVRLHGMKLTLWGRKLTFLKGQLKAYAPLHDGRLRLTVTEEGDSSLKVRGMELDEASRQRIIERMGLLLHRLRGPLNLLGQQEEVRTARRSRIQDQQVVRVGVVGGDDDVRAYYFDARDGLLRYVTAGADRAGGEGTVTTYEYTMLGSGMVFPSRLRVVNVGRHTLLGEQPLLEVEYSNVRMK